MIKSYVIIDRGLVEDVIFQIQDRLSIGRSPDNDIYLENLEISRRHAMVFVERGAAYVVDLKSKNGTYINGKRIDKSPLSHGDQFQCGQVTFRFVQKNIPLDDQNLAETQEFLLEEYLTDNELAESKRKSQRLMEAISSVPLFSGLDREAIRAISGEARLVVFDQDEPIIHQGDRANSMFIILDGSVEVITYDHNGDIIPLAVLTANQFFGEMSFLTGAPRNATVQAMENTLLCEIKFSVMREIVKRWPSIKYTLNKYYHERFANTEEKKRSAGLKERRQDPRFNIKLDVCFAFCSFGDDWDNFDGEKFCGFTKDISISGLQLICQASELMAVEAGQHIWMEIILPSPWGSIFCEGIIKNKLEGVNDQTCLSIAFENISKDQASRLELFLFDEEELY